MMTKQVPYFKGGAVRLVDEQHLYELQQREALLEASIRRQEALERAGTEPYKRESINL